jgi:intracellular proteinase inhibitor BsuPI
MRQHVAYFILMVAVAARAFGEEAAPASTPHKRGWLGRILHPFSSGSTAPLPDYKDPKLRGLTLDMRVTPQTPKLSEIRQLDIKLILTNQSKRAIALDFPTNQRIEIYLMNTAETVLTKWSDNHAITEKPGTVLINPQEHVEYNETITTRDLTPNKVFVAEVFFPQYAELRIRQKFLTSP